MVRCGVMHRSKRRRVEWERPHLVRVVLVCVRNESSVGWGTQKAVQVGERWVGLLKSGRGGRTTCRCPHATNQRGEQQSEFGKQRQAPSGEKAAMLGSVRIR